MQSDQLTAFFDAKLAVGTAPATEGRLLPRDFAGKWQVRRIVIDHLNRTRHDFTGSATITTTSIVEQGELQIGKTAIEASRAYQLAMNDDGIVASFPTGREFIRLGLANRQTVHHHCGADSYSGRFFFRNQAWWAEFWRVSGPRKRYSSLTRYRRLV
jgi:hypothetical protein